VRSSALIEDTPIVSFAGQLDTILGVANPADLVTAVRACWASLWSTRGVRYMRAHAVDPARAAMAVLVQRLVPARVAGGALSTSSDGHVVVTAAWGLGPAIAQGAVVPDRYVLRRKGPVLERVEPGCKERSLSYGEGRGLHWQSVARARVAAPCLDEAGAVALARLVLKAEEALGLPVEVEWALDGHGIHILQARPLVVESGTRAEGVGGAANQPWPGHPGLTGQPAGVGRAAGPARLVRTEAELARVRSGDVLVTRVPGPALAVVLPRVAGVVAELGGSTSHLAALARERGIPAVLGVRDATRRIVDGSLVIVDGVAGLIHPISPDVSNAAGLRSPGEDRRAHGARLKGRRPA